MIVVSDTTPLNYLIQIGQIDLLHRLYGQVIIPTTVATELQHLRAPAPVRAWIGSPPAWLEIRDVDIAEESGTLLDAGEIAALVLAELLHADLADGRPQRIRGSDPSKSASGWNTWRACRSGGTATDRSTEGSRTATADELLHLTSSFAISNQTIQQAEAVDSECRVTQGSQHDAHCTRQSPGLRLSANSA